MEKDSHYYVIYFLCLAAGLDSKTAYVIAYSSQYVDDSTDGREKTLIDQNFKEAGKFDPIRTSHNGFESIDSDVQEKIYYPFHFLPGLDGESFDQEMLTQPGSKGKLFNILIQEALNSKDPYRIGITLHVLADTYSHAGFSGLWTWSNDIHRVNYIPARRGWFKNLVNKWKWILSRKWFESAPAIGHSQAFKFPDFPYLNWKYFDYEEKMHSVSNSFRFKEAFQDLYENLVEPYARSQDIKPKIISQDKLLQELWVGIRTPGSLEKRCKYWQGVIEKYFPKELLKYKDTDWENENLKRLKKFLFFSSSRMKLKVPMSEFKESHYYRFHEAARKSRLFVMERINEYGMVISQEFIDNTRNKNILVEGIRKE